MNKTEQKKPELTTPVQGRVKVIRHDEKFYYEIYIQTPYAQIVFVTAQAEAEQIAQEINEKLFETSQNN